MRIVFSLMIFMVYQSMQIAPEGGLAPPFLGQWSG